MPRIIIYTDLSTNFPYAFSAIAAARENLAARNCHLPMAWPWRFGKMGSHQPLWQQVSKKYRTGLDDFSSLWQRWFVPVLQAADRNEDILFYGREPNPVCQKNFLDMLRAVPEFGAHDIFAIAVIGRPACLMEQHFRLIWSWQPLRERALEIASRYARLGDLVTLWRQELGEHFSIYADTSASPQANGLSGGHKTALGQLGIEPGDDQECAHELVLASRESRHILRLAEVRSNAWPYMDMAKFVGVLADIERQEQWDCRTICPPEYLWQLIDEAGRYLADLEKHLQLADGYLGCPREFLSYPEWRPYAGLSDTVIGSFAKSLPEESAHVLRQRYAQDEHLLLPGQKRIFRALVREGACSSLTVASDPPLLSVLTLTRNQEEYIGQCIEGVLAQKTDFPVQHIILDDCSTDNTPRIIRQYAEKYPSIRPVLLSSWVASQNVTGLFSRCRSKYAALCDGDDYFSEPTKLQKQVDFLESNPDCSMCFHPVLGIYEDKSQDPFVFPRECHLPRGLRKKYYLAELLFINFIQTNSVVYRWRFRDGLPDWFRPDLCPADWYWHLLHAETGKIGFLPQVMSVYRRHPASLFARSFQKNTSEHRRQHGMGELETYKAVNDHFRNRYFARIATLANSVFADFLQLQRADPSSGILREALLKYPEFGQNFLEEVKRAEVTRVRRE